MKKIIAGVIAVILIIFGVSYFNKNSKQSAVKEPIRIGAVLALTGNNASYGQPTKRGMDLAIEELNKDGKKINIIYEDDKSTNEGVASAFQKIIATDKVPVVLGFISSGGVLTASSIANSSKIVLLSTLASADEIKDSGDYVFRIKESSAIHGKEMAKYAKNTLGFDKVALYYANAANGISYANSFKKEFADLGGNIIFDGKYIEKANDFRSDLLKIKSIEPEAIYIAGVAPDMAQILIQAKELGVKTKWLASSGAESPKLIEIAKGVAEGLIFTSPAFNPNQANDLVQKFTEAYKQKYDEMPGFISANGYDGIMVVYDVIEKYGYNSEKIKNGLYSTKNYPGIGGTLSFDEFGEVQKPIMFKVVKDSQFVPNESN